MQRQGMYPSPKKPPFVPGLECAGIVEELGEEVTDVEVRSQFQTHSGLIVIIFRVKGVFSFLTSTQEGTIYLFTCLTGCFIRILWYQ